MKKINELNATELIEKGLDIFDLEDYALDVMDHETVKIGGYEYPEGTALNAVDPFAFKEKALDFQTNLIEDGLIEETKDGHLVWVQDVNLEELGLGPN